MSACNCDGTTAGVNQLAPDAFYHLSGTTSPSEDAILACDQAISLFRARGFDSCDITLNDVFQKTYQQALVEIANVTSTEPLSNRLQKWFDVYLTGTADPAASVTDKPKPSTNWTFLIGAILILALGFFLVFK